jgi:hypothetical protein
MIRQYRIVNRCKERKVLGIYIHSKMVFINRLRFDKITYLNFPGVRPDNLSHINFPRD